MEVILCEAFVSITECAYATLVNIAVVPFLKKTAHLLIPVLKPVICCCRAASSFVQVSLFIIAVPAE